MRWTFSTTERAIGPRARANPPSNLARRYDSTRPKTLAYSTLFARQQMVAHRMRAYLSLAEVPIARGSQDARLKLFYEDIRMKTAMIGVSLLWIAAAALADSPDSSFLKSAAQGGMSEVELGQLAQQKASNPAVKEFGAMMIKDHTAANEKLKALAASEQVSLPEGPSLMQKASKTRLNMLSGDSFDKSYVKDMIADHKDDIEEFQKEVSEGKDPQAKAFASATLPTLQAHLQRIQAVAASAGIKE
jgi:putative membrane protein